MSLDRPLAFLHIPKTAGTALLKLFERNLPAARIVRWYPPDRPRRPSSPSSGPHLLVGHFPMGTEDAFLLDPLRVTMLRDPIARTLSQLRFLRRGVLQRDGEVAREHQRWFADNEDLIDYIDYSKHWLLDNAQVRMLSGAWRKVPFGELGEEHLETAKRNLDRFDLIMSQAHYDEDVLRLSSRFGWWTHGARVNAGGGSSDGSLSRRPELGSVNELDLALHEHAMQRREQQLGHWPVSPSRRIVHRLATGAIRMLRMDGRRG